MAIDTAPPTVSTWRRRRPGKPDETEPEYAPIVPPPKPVPLNSMVAAARRVTTETISRQGAVKEAGWQSDAIDLFRLVGEERFLVNTLAGRVGAGRLYAGKLGEDPTQKPEMLKPEEKPSKIFEALGETPAGRAQLIARMSVNLQVPGDCWLVGIPQEKLEAAAKQADVGVVTDISPDGADADSSIDIETLKWFVFSVKEISSKKNSKDLQVTVNGRKITVSPDDVWPIRVWQPDPFDAESADSPARSSLPVLRELLGLTQYVSAQIDSRLAGAGMFIVPQSALDAVIAELGEDYSGEGNPFMDILMEAAMAAIEDRSSAASMVPIVVTVPDAVAGSDFWHHISFASNLDKEARSLREEAIRRLALGQDVPPEVLLGVGSMNHWGAWLVREDTITTHVEPQLALICDALTTQYLWPVLEQQGMAEAEFQQYVIWYDVDHLITRPNRLQDAIALHGEGVISDEALRDAGGFIDADAAVDVATTDEAARIVLEMVKQNASLLRNPGVEVLLENIRSLLKGGATPDQVTKEIAIPDEPEEIVDGELVEETDAPQAQPPMVAGGWPQGQQPITINLTMPESLTASISQPDIVVNVEPTPVHVHTPEVLVSVEPTPVTVNTPDVIVNTPEVNVNVEPTPVTVEAPTVEVAAPDVTVESPTVNVTTPDVTVNTPPIDVKPTDVRIVKETKKRKIRLLRDRSGNLTGAEEQ